MRAEEDKKLLLSIYWKERMHQRMKTVDEASRLQTILKGFFLDRTESEKQEYPTLFAWTASKRPYGTKLIEESIAFQLGWDRDRVLTFSEMPEFVRIEAMALHEFVRTNLLKEK
jgi:hypothetical protein